MKGLRPMNHAKNQRIVLLIVGLAFIALGGTAKPSVGVTQSDDDRLLIEKLTGYAGKALKGQWQISCREDIRREENRYKVVMTKRSTGEVVRRWELQKTVKSTSFYEYRLSLKGKKINEKRLSLAADNDLLYEGKDYGAILPYKDRNVVVNPMEYLSRISRGAVEYHVKSRERIGDFEARVIDFTSVYVFGEKYQTLTGKMWIHPDTGAVWRISLNPETWTQFEREEIPKEFGEVKALGHPAARRILTWTADFEVEAGEIRFPSRVEISETYEEVRGEGVKTNAWTIQYSEFRSAVGQYATPVDPGHPVLKKAADYCERLKTIALQYICDEHVTRTSYFYDVRRYMKTTGNENVGLPRKRWTLKRTIEREIVYDYQLIKKGDRLEEKRKTLASDGKPWTKEDEPVSILPYQARYIVYGPIGFLGSSWQTGFEYFDEGRERTDAGRETVIFMSQPNEFRDDNSVYGRVWVDPESGAVVRIAWDPESIDFFRPDDVPKMFLGLEKQLVWEAYYEVEKNGIYFPSRQVIREEYIGPEGEVILGDVWSVTYENYRFFTVGVDIEIKK